MPSYNYHLKFELYPAQNPTSNGYPANHYIWVPSEGSSIFDDLPSHPRRHQSGASKSNRKSVQLPDRSLPRVLDLTTPRNRSQSPTDPVNEENITSLTTTQWRARKESFPPPGFGAGIGPHKAARDWRFGRLSVESFDMPDAANKKEDGHAVPAASLGPTFGGPGQATKGRYVPLETKNTDVGWGIVHLYRESAGDSSSMTDYEVEEGEAQGAAEVGGDEDDGTILCIPAVPSYLSPSDFLGFVGEKWRGDVSHYRMVMTERMNRYMVLMKFRDKWRAQDWRKEFDGKVFNSMEVCLLS